MRQEREPRLLKGHQHRWFVDVDTHRIYCHDCDVIPHEPRGARDEPAREKAPEPRRSAHRIMVA